MMGGVSSHAAVLAAPGWVPTATAGRVDRRHWLVWALGSGWGSGWAAAASQASMGTHVQDLNQATRAEIEAVRGVGVELADRILVARERGHFSDWSDLRLRVKGVTRRALLGFMEAGFHIRNHMPADQK